MEQSKLIYKIPCQEGCSSCYVGMTKQRLRARLKQHATDIKNGKNNTALSEHYTTKGHLPNFDDAIVLAFESNYIKRKIFEMIYIKANPHSMNCRRDTENLSLIYSAFLQRTI